jgi:hypothetical protein
MTTQGAKQLKTELENIMAKPDPVAAALAQAEREAEETANTKASQETMHDNVPQTRAAGGAVAPAAQGQRRSLADLAASAAMAVDVYSGVDDLGIKFGKDKARFDEMLVTLRFADIKGGWVIRANTGGSAKYATSYDGATEAKSRKPWEQVIAEFERIDGGAYVSDLIEMPVTLTQELVLKDGKKLKAGTRIGISISYQNYKFFCPWFAEQLGKFGQDSTMKVRIGFQDKRNPGGAEYGVYTWKNLDDPQDEVFAAAA